MLRQEKRCNMVVVQIYSRRPYHQRPTYHDKVFLAREWSRLRAHHRLRRKSPPHRASMTSVNIETDGSHVAPHLSAIPTRQGQVQFALHPALQRDEVSVFYSRLHLLWSQRLRETSVSIRDVPSLPLHKHLTFIMKWLTACLLS